MKVFKSTVLEGVDGITSSFQFTEEVDTDIFFRIFNDLFKSQDIVTDLDISFDVSPFVSVNDELMMGVDITASRAVILGDNDSVVRDFFYEVVYQIDIALRDLGFKVE